ncbi:MAG: aminotransferase class V-fold PLP-dependent enzyme [Phycisphaerales bacterium]
MPQRTLPPFSPLVEHFGLDRDVVFLNHGSFGAVPLSVLRRQDEIRRRVELESVRFFVEELEPMLDTVRAKCAPFVGSDPEDFAFVHNATTGVNAVVRSLKFKPGDELLVGNQEYNACNNAFRFVAEQWGATVRSVEAPFPIASADEFADAVVGAVTERTKLVLLSHITSPTGIILPVERIIREVQARGADVLLDTAHGPGFVPLDIAKLGAAYTTGNFHKWCCAPKGSAFLHVRRDRQEGIHPTVISHGYNSVRSGRSKFRLEFDFLGSIDATPWLVTGDAIDAIPAMVLGGWAEVIRRNRALAIQARDLLCAALGTRPPAPDSMLGSLAAVLLPDDSPERTERLAKRPTRYMDALQDRLMDAWKIQVPVFRIVIGGKALRICRISAQVYNSIEQYEYLAKALVEELAGERKL